MKHNKRAFTLIELLVVVLIIGILSAVALPQYQKSVTKAKLANLKVLVESIVRAGEEYYLANNEYPDSFDKLSVTPTAISGGFCQINNTSEAAVTCENTNAGISYMRRFAHITSSVHAGKRSCRALSTNAAAVAVCKADTGSSSPYYNDGAWDSYWYQ